MIPASQSSMPSLALPSTSETYPCRSGISSISHTGRPIATWRLRGGCAPRQPAIGRWSCKAVPSEPESDRADAVPADRLYSTLDPQTLAHQPGSVFGAAALVAGTTVGAGILALPHTTEVLALDGWTAVSTQSLMLSSHAESRESLLLLCRVQGLWQAAQAWLVQPHTWSYQACWWPRSTSTPCVPLVGPNIGPQQGQGLMKGRLHHRQRLWLLSMSHSDQQGRSQALAVIPCSWSPWCSFVHVSPLTCPQRMTTHCCGMPLVLVWLQSTASCSGIRVHAVQPPCASGVRDVRRLGFRV